MVTAQDVHGVTFAKGMRGYQVEQVDDFLDRVADQLEKDNARIAELTKSNEEMKAKLYELAKKLESYRNDEEALKSALLNAQRMGENVIREARQKADALERESRIRSEDIARAGKEKIAEQEIELARIKGEVAQFKANVLSLYKSHIESLSTLPSEEIDEDEEDEEEEIAEIAPEQPAPAAAPAAPVSAAAAAKPAPKAEADADFWHKNEEELDPVPEKATPAPDTFRGITFSD